jgi:hypothetical protein
MAECAPVVAVVAGDRAEFASRVLGDRAEFVSGVSGDRAEFVSGVLGDRAEFASVVSATGAGLRAGRVGTSALPLAAACAAPVGRTRGQRRARACSGCKTGLPV